MTILLRKRMKIGIWASTATLIAATAGCMVGIDYKTPPTTAPASFGEAHAPATQPSAAITHYWKTFNDAELDSLIERATQNNNTFLKAKATVRQARAQLGVDIGSEFPTLSADASATREQTSRTLSPSVGGSTSGLRRTSVFSGALDAGWEIDIFGGTARQIQSDEFNLEAQVDARRYALVTLTSEVAGDYVLLRGYQLQLKLTRDNVDSEQKTLDLTKSRFSAGLVSDLDVAQAEASVYQTVAQEPALEIEIRQTIHAISILVGEEPMALMKELETAKPIPPSPASIPVGLPSELLRNRPDVMQSERLLAASTADIGVQVANLFPKFSLTGTLGQESGRLGLIAQDASNVWSIGPSVSWQILDYNKLQSQVRVANAQQAQALYTYRQTVLQSFADVENALVAYAQDQVRTKAIDQEVVANERAVNLSTQLYTQGIGTFLNVLTAERSLYSAQSDQAISQSNVATDLVALYKALGGGWDRDDEKQYDKFENPKTAAPVQ